MRRLLLLAVLPVLCLGQGCPSSLPSDGCPDDPDKTTPGVCGCGIPDIDGDGDQTADCIDGCPNDPNKTVPGLCGCGMADLDSDDDGAADCNDSCPNDASKVTPGVCGCGTPDTDANSDGTPDCIDATQPSGQAATVEDFQRATWLVLAASSYSGGTATSFAVSRNLLATNAHVAEGIQGVLSEPNGNVAAFQHETGVQRSITTLWVHPEYDADSFVTTPDVGLLEVAEELADVLPLASSEGVQSLSVFDEVSLCGFPGDVTFGLDLLALFTTGEIHPRVTCLAGTISALRPFDPGVPATPENTFSIQYDLPTSPGTSGSAVFDVQGEVIGVHASGFQSEDYNFAIRVDKLAELLDLVSQGLLPGIDVSSLRESEACSTRYYNPSHEFGFDPPAGWFGPEFQDTSDDPNLIVEMDFVSPIGASGGLIGASLRTTTELDPYAWISFLILQGSILLVDEVLSTEAGDTLYYCPASVGIGETRRLSYTYMGVPDGGSSDAERTTEFHGG